MGSKTRNQAPRAAGLASEFVQKPGGVEQSGEISQRRQQIQAASRRDLNAEARIQAAIVDWVRTVARQVLVFAVPNGGLRSKAEAARLKWTGVVAGVPDLVVIAQGGEAFFIEVKTPAGRLSPDQRDVHERLVAIGTPAAIVRSIDDARLAFDVGGIKTREAAR